MNEHNQSQMSNSALGSTMTSSTLAVVASGRPAIFQGRYGSRGNLELVTPSPEGGLVCCWFNSDPLGGPVTEPSIPAATWSTGLHFAPGTTYDAVAGIQTRRGPDFLELAATHAGGLHRWTWSPGPGFELTGDLGGVTGRPYVIETPAGVEVGTTEHADPAPPQVDALAGDADAAAWCLSEMGHDQHLEIVVRHGDRLTHHRVPLTSRTAGAAPSCC
jgi:hypothetical protein